MMLKLTKLKRGDGSRALFSGKMRDLFSLKLVAATRRGQFFTRAVSIFGEGSLILATVELVECTSMFA